MCIIWAEDRDGSVGDFQSGVRRPLAVRKNPQLAADVSPFSTDFPSPLDPLALAPSSPVSGSWQPPGEKNHPSHQYIPSKPYPTRPRTAPTLP